MLLPDDLHLLRSYHQRNLWFDCYAQSKPYEGAEEDTHQVRDAMYTLLRSAY